MPTDAGAPAAIFLFAHQDDEFGVYALLEEYRRRQIPVRCLYFTDGATAAVSAAIRNAESTAVLARLGVASTDIVFAGELLGIADATLALHLERAADWLDDYLARLAGVYALHVPCWEGGHPDHDALHAIAVDLAQRRGLLDLTTQFALYNGARMVHPFFRVLSPLPENGKVSVQPMSWAMRLRALRCCLSYPSQRRTWIGLFPFVVLSYLMAGRQSLQAVDPARTQQRPHSGALYYELRKFFTWEQMDAALRAWRGRGKAL